MSTKIFTQVEQWHCQGLPATGLTDAEREAVIESALGFYLAEHVAHTEPELQSMDDHALVATHYAAMVDASR